MQMAIFAILGLVSIIVGFLLSIILPDSRFFGWILIAFGVLLVSGAAILDFRRVKGAVTSNRGKIRTSTSLMISIFVGIVVIVNAVGYTAYHQFDVTSLSQFTLTAQTKSVLDKLTMDVTAKLFIDPNDTTGVGNYAGAMLLEYQKVAPKLKVQFIDPDKSPEEARKYGIVDPSLYNTVIFETTNPARTYPVFPSQIQAEAEHAYTNAILEVTGIIEKRIYFTTGNGEASATTNLTQVVEILQTNLLQVVSINLDNLTNIPTDCALLVVAGPTSQMSDNEKKLIQDYLNQSGAAFFMTNPDSPDDIAQILAPWGVAVQKGTLIDPTSHLTGRLDAPVVVKARSLFATSDQSVITSSVFFPGATAIVPQDKTKTNMDVRALVWTTTDAWLESNYDPSVTPKFDEAKDKKQAWGIGAFIAPTEILDSAGNSTGTYNSGPYIVVIGDSDFITDANINSGNNADLFVYIVRALSQGSDIVTIDRKVLSTRRLVISPEATTFLNISSIALLPALVLIIGALMWWRRK